MAIESRKQEMHKMEVWPAEDKAQYQNCSVSGSKHPKRDTNRINRILSRSQAANSGPIKSLDLGSLSSCTCAHQPKSYYRRNQQTKRLRLGSNPNRRRNRSASDASHNEGRKSR